MNIAQANQHLEKVRTILQEYPFSFQRNVKNVMRLGVGLKTAIEYCVKEEFEILYHVEGKGFSKTEFFWMWFDEFNSHLIWQLIGYSICDDVWTWQECIKTLTGEDAE